MLTYEELIEQLHALEARMPRESRQEKRRLSAFHVMVQRLQVL